MIDVLIEYGPHLLFMVACALFPFWYALIAFVIKLPFKGIAFAYTQTKESIHAICLIPFKLVELMRLYNFYLIANFKLKVLTMHFLISYTLNNSEIFKRNQKLTMFTILSYLVVKRKFQKSIK